LPSATEVTEGRITRVQHFDSKNDVEKYAEKVKGDEIIVSYLWTGLFASNFKEGTVSLDSPAFFLSILPILID